MSMCWLLTRHNAPSAVAKIRAVLSVLPAMMYSPVGLHARSYTCIVVQLIVTAQFIKMDIIDLETHRNVVLGFQYSLSSCKSSGLRSLPYATGGGLVDGAHIMIIPSGDVSRNDHHVNNIAYHPPQTRSPRLDSVCFSNL